MVPMTGQDISADVVMFLASLVGLFVLKGTESAGSVDDVKRGFTRRRAVYQKLLQAYKSGALSR